MVSEGASPPPEDGNTLASAIHRLRQRWLHPKASTTELAASSPIRQVPNTWVAANQSQLEGREPAKFALAGGVIEAATADHAGNRIGRIEVPGNGIARQASPAMLRFAMQRSDGDGKRVHEVLPDFAAFVAEAVGGKQQP